MPSPGDPVPTRYEVVRLGPDDWRSYRELRLGMLADSPEAFWTRLEDLEHLTEADWRHRADGRTTQVRDAEGVPVGTVTVHRAQPEPHEGLTEDDALVLAVYVVPAARGRGVVDILLDEAHERARELGVGRLVLHVNEHNARGIGAYERHGYQLTGHGLDHPNQPGVRDLEMTRPVDGTGMRGGFSGGTARRTMP